MPSGNAWRDSKREVARRTLTELNEETTRRHAICQMTGGCQPSGATVTRMFQTGLRELPTCRACGVPIGAPKVPNWASGAK